MRIPELQAFALEVDSGYYRASVPGAGFDLYLPGDGDGPDAGALPFAQQALDQLPEVLPAGLEYLFRHVNPGEPR